MPEQLRSLYAYLKSGEADGKDAFIQKIHGEVAALNQRGADASHDFGRRISDGETEEPGRGH